MYAMKYDYIYPSFPYPIPSPSQFLCLFLCLDDHKVFLSVVHLHMGVGPSAKAWEPYKWTQPQKT